MNMAIVLAYWFTLFELIHNGHCGPIIFAVISNACSSKLQRETLFKTINFYVNHLLYVVPAVFHQIRELRVLQSLAPGLADPQREEFRSRPCHHKTRCSTSRTRCTSRPTDRHQDQPVPDQAAMLGLRQDRAAPTLPHRHRHQTHTRTSPTAKVMTIFLISQPLTLLPNCP